MAMKDWKKVGKSTWRQVKRGRIIPTIDINRQMVPFSILSSKEQLKYGVQIGYSVIDGTTVIDRAEYFKTKAQALKFAKAYMRKH